MDLAKLIVCAIAALPAGYIVGVLIDRIPENLSLLTDLPAPRFTGRYLAGHVVLMAAFLSAAIRFDHEPWIELLPVLVFVTSGVALSITDFACYRLPDRLVVPTLLTLVVMITVIRVAEHDAKSIQYAIAGAGMYFGFLFVFHLAAGPRGLGFGDVKLSAILGLMLGFGPGLAGFGDVARLAMWATLIGFSVSVILGFALFIIRGKSRGYPLGPFLVFGTCLTIVVSKPILFG
jgi:prepilin signal peptidase PulO-like enzyme (type II secretory pathway)